VRDSSTIKAKPLELVRTVKVELLASDESRAALRQLPPLITAAMQDAVGIASDHRFRNYEAFHHAVYVTLRARFPRLPSQMVCNVQKLAYGAAKALRSLEANGQAVSKPLYRNVPIPYDARTMKVRPNGKDVSLTTIGPRVECRLRGHRQLRRYFRDGSGWSLGASRVYETPDGRLWIAISFSRKVAPRLTPETFDPSTHNVVGGDRGLVVPLALSDGRLLGDPHWHSVERRYFNTQRSLQRKGTKSAKRRAKRRSRKWSRFRADADNRLTAEVLRSLPAGTVLALEDLTDIRTRGRRFNRKTRRRLHAWPFRRQQVMFEYKAGEHGITIVYVDPHYTSQRCSCCGYTARNNRRSQSWFKCRACGHAENADVNAARNIRTAALDAANWIVTQQQGDPPVATRKGHVSPPYAAHEKPVARTPKVGGGGRASGAAKVTKRSRRQVAENPAL
jgi:IS605 OrfB family transposase